MKTKPARGVEGEVSRCNNWKGKKISCAGERKLIKGTGKRKVFQLLSSSGFRWWKRRGAGTVQSDAHTKRGWKYFKVVTMIAMLLLT